MQEQERHREKDDDKTEETDVPVEEAEHPIPGIEHRKEPDAENIMPAEDQPGTL